MKTFIFIIIFLMMYLIIQHFIGYSQEGLANCNPAQHDLTYQNTGIKFKRSQKPSLRI